MDYEMFFPIVLNPSDTVTLCINAPDGRAIGRLIFTSDGTITFTGEPDDAARIFINKLGERWVKVMDSARAQVLAQVLDCLRVSA